MENKEKQISSRHWSLKEKARELRAQGWSYKEILTEVKVAKSSISSWVRDVPLTQAQKERLWAKHSDSMKGVKAIQNMFWRKRCEAYEKGTTLYYKYKSQSDFIAGLMLYWAEGNKSGQFGFTNSDQSMVKVIISWLDQYFNITPSSLTFSMNIHSGQNEEELFQAWEEVTKIPRENFRKSFIKPEGIGYKKNILYYGTARIRIKGTGATYYLFTVLGSLAEYLKDKQNITTAIENWIPKLPHAD